MSKSANAREVVAPVKLNQRKQKVLEAVVEDHIATAEPVSSRTIARKYKLGVSPATIRNEMADLEDAGLIEQPHTSAGRIPSQKGYRYYVDWLMRKGHLTEREKGMITSIFAQQARQLMEVIQRTIRIVSQCTDYLVFLSGPQLEHAALHKVRFVLLAPGKAMLVIVSENGWVENKLIDLPTTVSQEELEQVERVFNEYFRGLTFSQITRAILESVYGELSRQRALIDLALDVIEYVLKQESDDALYLGGTRNILKQPEYKDIQQVRKLLDLIEEQSILRSVLAETEDEGVTVRIGKENRFDLMQNCSVVTATYKMGGNTVGAFGLLGPMRMNYARAIALVEFITQTLSDTLTKTGF